MTTYTIPLDQLSINDVESVGGKNASLGEMLANLSNLGVSVPNGFATTAEAYREFLATDGLNKRINDRLNALDVDDIDALTSAGADIRRWVTETPFQPAFDKALQEAFVSMQDGNDGLKVAVRSSATAEDLPDASFAGQQETFLNIEGAASVRQAVHEVFASLFNDRAISYRVHQGYAHENVALSAGIQRMVRSETGSAGVMFTLDTESGFDDVVFVTSSYGLGETVVQGSVNPDEFYVHKPTLRSGKPAVVRRNLGSKLIKMVYSNDTSAGRSVNTVDVSLSDRREFSINDADVEELARQALVIEEHYGRPMDIEWAKDGDDKKLYIVQARPETVTSQADANIKTSYLLKNRGEVIVEGRSIGQKIASGRVRKVDSIDQMNIVQDGDILVTDMTDPDWEPVMKRASAIVTNRGGRTCHAAIIARELGIAAIVGCGDATEKLETGRDVTVSCAEGDTGFIYDGLLDFERQVTQMDKMPEIPFKIMQNVGNPDRAFTFAQLPHEGIGLARLKFIINRMIGVHPKALIEYDRQSNDVKAIIDEYCAGYPSPTEFFVQKLSEGIATLGAAFSPKRVIVRLSDFKSNEYAHMVGGHDYEPDEENPMLGFRGASRYIAPEMRDCFELECRAVRYVREVMGLTNVEIMIPFVRTTDEASQVIDLLAENGLKRGENGLKIIMMCELPANALLAEEFLEYFDGFSIGSNDMTQLTLGLDRDSGIVSHLFDERNPAVMKMLSMAIKACNKAGKYVGICGQGPSDHPELAEWLFAQGIDSVSLNPDSVIETWERLSKIKS
ncbi:MAG TPA: phosphoenolpyruvate synthase [Gammaproteobacteria bacterium]|nr:phosphoenolpyruvate synthase [Gammaproteobacteria bacterium]